MTSNTTPAARDRLAIEGGPKAVTAEAPANWLHGPNELGEEEIHAVTEVLRSKIVFRFGHPDGMSRTAAFEAAFAHATGAKYALAVNSGTSALIAGLIGVGVSQGDEVLVPAYTYIATAAAVLAIGAFPVLVEVDKSLSMCPVDMERKITERTRAAIPVHMRGAPCDIVKIVEVARRRGIAVLEDVAQANGGHFRGRALGTFGDAGAFSMQHYKIMTCGEGGMVITNSKQVFERAAVYHDSAYAFWMEAQRESPEAVAAWKQMSFLGENYRQSELHSAVGLAQLAKRDRILARTRAICARLAAACEKIPGVEMSQMHDREGDCGIALVFFMPDAAQAVGISDALQAEGVNSGTAFSKKFPDRHIYYHWNYVIDKGSPHRNGFPWTSEQRPPRVSYTRDQCPRTIALLERAVMLQVTQIMSDEYVDQVVAAIHKVARLWKP